MIKIWIAVEIIFVFSTLGTKGFKARMNKESYLFSNSVRGNHLFLHVGSCECDCEHVRVCVGSFFGGRLKYLC